MKKYNVLDLFSGAGGFSLGFRQEGSFNITVSIDCNEKLAETHIKNFPDVKHINKDILDFSSDEIKKLNKEYKFDVIIGGPPCQGFSLAGKTGRNELTDERNNLFLGYLKFVKVIHPKIFVMENVAKLATHKKGETLKTIIRLFEENGYIVNTKIINASDYGVAQNRRRIIIVGTLTNGFVFPEKEEKKITVKDVIDDLPILKSGETSKISNHNAMNHTEQMLKKMSYVKDGGDRNDIPEEFRPKSGDARKYIRYNSNEPSVCVTGDMRKIFHYNQNRALTNRELARIQSFPDEYIFYGTSIIVQQQIGNAVPPKVAKKIAEKVHEFLKKKEIKIKNHKYPKINYIGNKEKLADWIIEHFPVTTGKVLDLFSGGVSLSYKLKERGYEVISNDILYSNFCLSKALIENDSILLKLNLDENKLNEYFDENTENELKWLSNFLYFPEEIRELTCLVNYSKSLKGIEKYLFLSLLRRAMIRKLPYSRMNIKWTEIVKLRDEEYSYMKYKRKRAYHNKSFLFHIQDNLTDYNNAVFNNGKHHKAIQKDAFICIKTLKEPVDVVYIDPPYPSTMNKYQDFYGAFDKIFHKECKYTNLTEKETFLKKIKKLLMESKKIAKYAVLSLNNKTKPSYEEIKQYIKNEVKEIKIQKKEHVYKVTGKENKQTNYEILMIIKF